MHVINTSKTIRMIASTAEACLFCDPFERILFARSFDKALAYLIPC